MAFKKLFEVRLLHDYYLNQSDGASFYSLNQQNQENRLAQQISYNRYKISDDIKIEPSNSTKQVMKNYRLRHLPTGLGFVVVAEVQASKLDDGTEVYHPFIKLPNDLNLGFILSVKNADFRNFSALSFNPNFPFHYYFNNKNEDNNKQFPSLSQAVELYLDSQTYEMGDLALFGATQKQAILTTKDSALTDWQAVEGEGMVHQNDRHLLPKRFLYKFKNDVLSAEFTLNTLSGDLIKKISTPSANTSSFKQIRLDFANQNPIAPAILGKEIPDGWYQLLITTNSGINIERKILLCDELYSGKSLGAIQISNAVTDADFRISTEDGALITKVLADETIVPHPIFEIRWRSRSTYWRYKKETDFDIIDLALTSAFLNFVGNDLVTKNPVALSAQLIHFQDNHNTIPLRLPNPSVSSIQAEPNGKTYSNVYISKVNLLTSS